MLKISSAKALSDYKIWIQYSDEIEGEVDLSHLVGKGVFSIWKDMDVFQDFRIENGRSLAWSNEVDLCADALYLEITGKTPEEIFSKLKMEDVLIFIEMIKKSRDSQNESIIKDLLLKYVKGYTTEYEYK